MDTHAVDAVETRILVGVPALVTALLAAALLPPAPLLVLAAALTVAAATELAALRRRSLPAWPGASE